MLSDHQMAARGKLEEHEISVSLPQKCPPNFQVHLDKRYAVFLQKLPYYLVFVKKNSAKAIY